MSSAHRERYWAQPSPRTVTGMTCGGSREGLYCAPLYHSRLPYDRFSSIMGGCTLRHNGNGLVWLRIVAIRRNVNRI